MVDNKEIRLYTVGDSHGWHAWLKIPWVEVTHLGPMTMHMFGQSKPMVAAKIGNDEGKPICLCYGEIDCRFRVHEHQPWKETINSLVEDFFKVVDENAKINPKIFIFNILPPPRRDHLPDPKGNPSFPFLGSDDERLTYVTYMNNLLRANSKYPLLDVYKHYCDEDGFLNMEMSDSHVHIKDEKPLKEAVEKLLKEMNYE